MAGVGKAWIESGARGARVALGTLALECGAGAGHLASCAVLARLRGADVDECLAESARVELWAGALAGVAVDEGRAAVLAGVDLAGVVDLAEEAREGGGACAEAGVAVDGGGGAVLAGVVVAGVEVGLAELAGEELGALAEAGVAVGEWGGAVQAAVVEAGVEDLTVGARVAGWA